MIFTYFQSHAVTLTYDDELQLGTATWNGFLSSDDFRAAVEVCLRLVEEHKPLRWLGDNRKLRAIRQADQEWFSEHVLPHLAASSICRHATVVSEDMFNRMAVEQLIKRANSLGDMVIKEFDNADDALAWLKDPVVAKGQL
ncbi:SpoIIAA family protein [Pontibacter mangrovi]|uniref:STAS/SEC14 domain-containing protein n=1 Tax=Pontibacter mangrovi TaxID=2589816 RepID=A0A501WAV2_9BACT|nr:STAS/SEC14 domain-containing protein [Pontibacter mangrovi]TPE45480.1 STAS/SEC14 domain-containing protein [Pontibacter mangrovi]